MNECVKMADSIYQMGQEMDQNGAQFLEKRFFTLIRFQFEIQRKIELS